MSAGEDVQHQCLVLAASQAHSSQSAALFLGSWVSPPLVHSLSVSSWFQRLSVHLSHTSGTNIQSQSSIMRFDWFLEAKVFPQFHSQSAFLRD